MIKGILFFAAFTIAIIFSFLVVLSQALIWNDCYDAHFKECEEAHSKNKTFAYCSGFMMEPRPEDFQVFCAFHPEEGCSEIPHGCVLQDNQYLVGFRVPFTKLEWRFG